MWTWNSGTAELRISNHDTRTLSSLCLLVLFTCVLTLPSGNVFLCVERTIGCSGLTSLEVMNPKVKVTSLSQRIQSDSASV